MKNNSTASAEAPSRSEKGGINSLTFVLLAGIVVSAFYIFRVV